MLGLLGKKVGMTRLFDENGASIPVTVIDVSTNRVAQVKTTESDGYTSLQVAYGENKPHRMSKAKVGHLVKHEAGSAFRLREFRLTDKDDINSYKPGQELSQMALEQSDDCWFKVDQLVDVAGISKGKGFAGVMKRHHFRGNRASHGNSRAHRKAGSTGQCQDPGRVFPGKKMAGHLGSKRNTIQRLRVVRVDHERSLMFIRGAVPGSAGQIVEVKPTCKPKRILA